MKADLETLYVVEYSVLQDAFHICTARDMLTKNIRAVSKLVSTDYVPLALATTYERAAELESELRAQVDELSASVRERRRREVIDALDSPLSLSDLISSLRQK